MFVPGSYYSLLGIGAETRLFLAVTLVLALFHWRKPPDIITPSSWHSQIAVPWLLLILAQIGCAYGVSFLPGHLSFPVFNILTIFVAGMGLVAARRVSPPNRPLYICLSALIISVQTAAIYMLGAAWSHTWWLAHLLFLVIILILGHAIITAYLTTRSFADSQSESEILALMREAEAAADIAHRANAAKSRFMAAASHDLRQPLVPIKLFAELLEAEIGRTKQGPLVRKLRGAVQSLDDLLNKMMEFSRLEAGIVHVRSERVHLGEVLKRFHQEFGPVAEAKGLTLRCVNSRSMVRTDRVLLELILRNLIENAIRYTTKGRVLIGCRRSKDYVLLCVYDTGIGISNDLRQDIFTEFFQGNAEGSNQRIGLGLGLATVERVSHLIEAPITVESVPGKGSRFTVTLPRIGERRSQLRPTGKKPLPDPGLLKILLIDDDPEVRDGVVAALLRRDWEPLVATNVTEAIETVQSEGPPDAIVTDLRLNPRECGLDAIAAIHKETGRTIASVIITGDASHHRLPEAMSSPWPILVKPFSTEELYSAVTEMVLKERASSTDEKM